MAWLRRKQGRIVMRWDAWLDVKRAENHLADLLVIGCELEELDAAYKTLASARDWREGCKRRCR